MTLQFHLTHQIESSYTSLQKKPLHEENYLQHPGIVGIPGLCRTPVTSYAPQNGLSDVPSASIFPLYCVQLWHMLKIWHIYNGPPFIYCNDKDIYLMDDRTPRCTWQDAYFLSTLLQDPFIFFKQMINHKRSIRLRSTDVASWNIMSPANKKAHFHTEKGQARPEAISTRCREEEGQTMWVKSSEVVHSCSS